MGISHPIRVPVNHRGAIIPSYSPMEGVAFENAPSMVIPLSTIKQYYKNEIKLIKNPIVLIL